MGQNINLVQTVLGVIKLGSGLKNESDAATAASIAEKTKPVRKTSQYDRDALNLTESEVMQGGLSDEAEQAYNDTVDRQVANSVGAILKGGGSLNNIGDIYTAGEEGRQKLALMEDTMRLNKINNLLKSYDKMAEEDQANWLVNLYAPYKDKLQAIGEQKKAAQDQINSGMDTIGAGIGGGGGGGGFGSFFGGGGSSGGGGRSATSVGTDGGTYPNFPSDKRLKRNCILLGKSPSGINVYEFNYIGSDIRYQGVIAQEVPDAAFVSKSGFLWVNYSKIDVEFKQL